ncbi:MAG TPA: RNA polymerase sigma factor, partial [Vicinamibacterales bacterium]|nr:RNA polymerase sigma factor [Vicinamibacterales bacterium]
MDRPGAEADAEARNEFSALYRTYAGDVRRFALFLSGDPSLADDLVSETFIRMWKARARVDLTTVKAYLFAIARNLYLHHRRRDRRFSELGAEPRDPAPGPHERAHAREEWQAVLGALQMLPEVDRAAVLMRADAGLPYDEIARALGISEAAAKVKVHRARMKLAVARHRAAPADRAQ